MAKYGSPGEIWFFALGYGGRGVGRGVEHPARRWSMSTSIAVSVGLMNQSGGGVKVGSPRLCHEKNYTQEE